MPGILLIIRRAKLFKTLWVRTKEKENKEDVIVAM